MRSKDRRSVSSWSSPFTSGGQERLDRANDRLDAKVVEKHLTLDNSMEGNDHKVSLLPEDFKSMVNCIRDVEQALGKYTERRLSQGELINREVLAKSLITNRNLEIRQTLSEDMIEVKSPGKGLQPNRKKEFQRFEISARKKKSKRG